MKKIFRFLVAFTLFFAASGCGKAADAVSFTSSAEEATEVWNTSYADVSHVDKAKKLVSFSFDDAPDNTIRKLVDVFTQFNEENSDQPASATFFINGIHVDDGVKKTLKTAWEKGFELGNHTYSHKNLTKLSDKQIREEIDKVDEILKDIDGRERHLVRAPYGRIDERVKKQSAAPFIDWSVDTEDWTGISADRIVSAVFKGIFPGAIILMHDGYPHTVDAVKRLLPALKEEGYQVVNVSQLAKISGVKMCAGKLYTHFNYTRK